MQHHNRLYGNSIMKALVPMVIRAVPLWWLVEGMKGRDDVIFDIFGFSIDITGTSTYGFISEFAFVKC